MALSFGQYIAKRRKELNLSQKGLSAKINKEDGSHISAQYLNDLERQRRNPPGAYLLNQFSIALDVDKDFLFYLSDGLPDDLKRITDDPKKVAAALSAFRKELGRDP